MDFRDTLSADLPAPRDDEPGGLRQDILDELADHLACSYNRELLRRAKPDEARRRAIERFGNPAAVARRLWFDAMRGKIMVQRVLIATCLVAMAACFGVIAIVWSQTNLSSMRAAEVNGQLVELLGQTQATNQEMLRQLQAMAKPAQPAKSAEWIPVTFKLTVEKPDGPPAVGYEVMLQHGYSGPGPGQTIRRRTDTTGLADFGVVRPGDWQFTIQAGKWQASAGLNAVPDTSVAKAVVVPKIPPDRARVRIRVDWPKPLADKNLVVIALFRPRAETYQPPMQWSSPDRVQIVCGPRGELLDFPSLPLFIPENTESVDQRGGRQNDDLLTTTRVYGPFDLDTSIAGTDPFELDEGPYLLARLLVLRPAFVEGGVGNRYELLTLFNTVHDQSVRVQGWTECPELTGIPMKPSWQDKLDRFDARTGEVSEWVISLPEEMARLAEKKLRAEPSPRKPG